MKITDFLLLLVEDDPDHVLLTRRALAQANLVNPVHIAVDGEQAIAYLSGQGEYSDRMRYPLPRLVLLDLRLPKVSGLEVLRWIRSQPHLRALPVIVLSSSSETQDIDHAYGLGVNSYLQKPVRFDSLIEMLKSIGMYWMILAQIPKEPSSAAKGKGARAADEEKAHRVLLLDEDTDFARAMMESLRLRKPSITVDAAVLPSEALNRLSPGSHAALVYDVDGSAGLDAGFLPRVKALVPGLPIVGLSVGAVPEDAEKGATEKTSLLLRKQARLGAFTTELHRALVNEIFRNKPVESGTAKEEAGVRKDAESGSWRDTDLLGRQHSFKQTSWDLVRSAGSPEALDGLIRIYWKPLYYFVRKKGFDHETAKDVVQEFLTSALERNMFSKADPARGRFRTFLLVALSNFIKDRARMASREKRGGGQTPFSFDFEASGREFTLEVDAGISPEEIAEKAWARSLLDQSISELKGSAPHLLAFRLQVQGLDIESIALETGLSESAVKTAVHRLKLQLRDILRGYVCRTSANEEEIELEMAGFAALLR